MEPIDITPAQRKTILSLLNRHLPGVEVWAFGSRVKWTSRPESDLDLAAFASASRKSQVSALKEAFEESDIPFRVDLLVWDELPESFQKNIRKEHIVFAEKADEKDTPGGWRLMKVSEFSEVIGGGTPSTKCPEYWGGDIPWLTPKDLSEHQARYITRGERSISRLGLENSSAKLVPANTVLLTSRAPVGYVAIAKNPVTTNQGFRSLVAKKGFDPQFIYYHLLNGTEYMQSRASGSTFPEISGSTLGGLEFLMPPFDEQKAIARILGALDDLIDLNRRTNETLEQIARALFNHYFPYSPDDDLPEGWKVGTIDEIAGINTWTLGRNDSLPRIEYIDISSVDNGNIDHVQVFECGQATPSRARRRLRHGDTVLSTVRPDRGAYFLCLDPSPNLIASTGFAVLSPKTVPWSFLYTALTSPDASEYFGQHADGGAYPAIRPEVIKRMNLVLPQDRGVIEQFDGVAAPLFELAETNRRSSRTLAALRDLLLPKLMSGEIRVDRMDGVDGGKQ